MMKLCRKYIVNTEKMECFKELPMFIMTLNEGIISIESVLLSMVIIDRDWVYI